MAMLDAVSATFRPPTAASDWRVVRSVDYARHMRTLIPCLLLLGCDTPGTFGSDLFGSDASTTSAQADMIAQLEAEPEVTPPPERNPINIIAYSFSQRRSLGYSKQMRGCEG